MAKNFFTSFLDNMRIATTAQNFYGYKNIISDEISARNGMITFIAAQLNDEEQTDLAEYNKLKTLLGQSEDRINNDSLCITYTHLNGNKPNLFIDNQVLFWGNELRWLRDNRPAAMPLNEYKKLEAINLKAYTLIASITKRMIYDKFNHNDNGINNVIRSFMRVMTKFTKDDNASFDVLQHAFSTKFPFQETAEKFNQTCINTMTKFFR